jgi:putative protease
VLDAGVKVLKIEGRGKGPEYVKTTVECYKAAVEAYFEGTYSAEKAAHWKIELEKVYHRGFWSGYYLGQELGEWNETAGSKATIRKVYLGKGNHYFNKIQVAEFKMESHKLAVGDAILITGPTTGVIEMVITELHTDNGPVQEAFKGDKVAFKTPMPIRPTDKLYKIVDASEVA